MRARAPMTGGMETLRAELDRLERLVEAGWFGDLPRTGTTWTPTMDVDETADAIVVTLAVPGVDETKIKVSLDDQVLVIKGEKAAERGEQGRRYLQAERVYGAFTRAVSLRAPVVKEKTTARVENGILTVRIPRMLDAAEAVGGDARRPARG